MMTTSSDETVAAPDDCDASDKLGCYFQMRRSHALGHAVMFFVSWLSLNFQRGGSIRKSGCDNTNSSAALAGLSSRHVLSPSGVSNTLCMMPSVATMYEPGVTSVWYAASSAATCALL